MEEQKKKKSPVGILLLIILALLVGGGFYLYYSVVKAPLELADPAVLAAAKPMAAQERFQVNPEDQTVQVKMEESDLWSLILSVTGNDFLDVINDELSSYGLSVSGCGIAMNEKGLALELELFYKETRLVAKVPCALEVSGTHLSLQPAGVKLGVIPLPVKGLLSGLKLDYDLCLPLLTDVTQVEFAQDALLLTGPLEPDVRSLVPLDEKLYRAAIFWEPTQPLADALLAQDGFATVLDHLAQEPGDVEALYRDLFALAEPEVMESYLQQRHGLTERFFPGLDFSAIAQEQSALIEQLTAQGNSLEQLFTELVNHYNEKRFQLSDGVFLFSEYHWQKKEPFQVAQYGAERYAELFSQLDPEEFFLILVGAEDGFIRKTSSFYRMCDENQKFTQEMDFNKTYILGCVFRSVDGDPFLLYETEIRQNNTYARSFKYLSLTEAEVSALQVPETFGVWTD